MASKTSKLNSMFLSVFWIIFAWVFISIILGIVGLSGFSYSKPGFSLLNFVKGSFNNFYILKQYWLFFLLLSSSSFILGMRSSKSPSFARYLTYTLGLIAIVVFLLAWLFLSKQCEGLGCIGHGIVLLIEAGVYTVIISVLPIAAAHYLSNRNKLKVDVLSTFRPGVLVIIATSLMLIIPNLSRMSEKLKDQEREHKRLFEAKSDLKLLEPAYLPDFVNPKRGEDEEVGGVRYSYRCNSNDGHFNIVQVKLDKARERLSETKTKYKTNPNLVKNLEKGWTIMEKIIINDYEGLYFHDNMADKVIWETDESQITIQDYHCLGKQELIQIAGSMRN